MRRRFALLLLVAAPWLAVADNDDAVKAHPWDGSRSGPVHRFSLYDENGDVIVPEYSAAMPFSTRTSCGSCHDYPTVAKGWHFSSSKGQEEPGRAGEPWFLVDRMTGTQLPLSYRGWARTWKPEDVGMTPWDFTRTFGRHLPGGDMAEPSDDLANPEARWDLSGKVEINCMGCHSPDPAQDPSEWAKQIARENFRWAATAASGVGEVLGMASRMHDSWRLVDGPNRDDSQFAVAPAVRYDLSRFDRRHRAVVDVTRRPPDRNCQQCHSVSAAKLERWQAEEDVHSRAGIRCVDCHRNGLGHDIVRGYETEAKERGQAQVAEFSCRGCHLGGAKASAGRMGAPRPEHAGLPAVHLEKLSCTACHAGPMPGREAVRVRTSRANRLGIYGRALWFTDAPQIVEPVFVKGQDGMIAPHRLMWPAFWAKVDGEKLSPLAPERVAEATKGILDGEERLLAIFTALGPTNKGVPVFVTKGKIFRATLEGELKMEDFTSTPPASEPWWGRVLDDKYSPLVEDVDSTEALEGAIEQSLLITFEALAKLEEKGAPAVVCGDMLLRRAADATLEVLPRPAGLTTSGTQWLWGEADKYEPLLSQCSVRALLETHGQEQSLTEEQVELALKALGEKEGAQKVAYVASGKLLRLGSNGKLEAASHEAAEPVVWPMGHDVRPASQSLGAKSCQECHSADSPFFFAQVKGEGPLKTALAASKPMHELQGVDGGFERLFGASFALRSSLKTLLFLSAGLIGVVLFPVSFLGLRRFARSLGPKS